MINFDVVRKKETKEHNANWSEISYYPYRMLIIRGYGSGKTNYYLIW